MKLFTRAVATITVAGIALTASPGMAQAAPTPVPADGTIEIISVDDAGVTTGEGGTSMSWDGRFVAGILDGASGGYDVLLHDNSSGEKTVIGSPDHTDTGAVISANARHVFYVTDEYSIPTGSANHPQIARYTPATGATKVFDVDQPTGDADRWGVGQLSVNATGTQVAFRMLWVPASDPKTPYDDIVTLNTATGDVSAFGVGESKPHTFRGAFSPDISGDGQVVAFQTSKQLVVEDANYRFDVYTRDLATGVTTLVSRGPRGYAINAPATGPKISFDGRLVGYTSAATNVVPGQAASTEGRAYVFDRQSSTTAILTPDSAAGINSGSVTGISKTGRYVSLESGSINLGIPTNPSNPGPYVGTQVYRYDRMNDTIELVTRRKRQQYLSSAGAGSSSISSDGQHIAFASIGRDLITDSSVQDEYGSMDFFVWSK